ncbi:MAG: response regulator, partial [Lachnospiraceae bacterium]|nr:response regulator [Lachnospiraceae bacterium]
LGWNVSYIFLFLSAFEMRDRNAGKFFHPLMLLPIPINIFQFYLYLPYGGIINNLYQGIILTVTACFCLRGILYYLKNRKNGTAFPYFQAVALLFLTTEYGMWTSSCFSWPDDVRNPYYYLEFAHYILALFFAYCVKRDYEAAGFTVHEKSTSEFRSQLILQMVLAFFIMGTSTGGYAFAEWVKNSFPDGTPTDVMYRFITIILFGISAFLVVVILGFIYLVKSRFKEIPKTDTKFSGNRRGRTNFILTLFVTLVLMVTVVIYNCRILYNVSVNNVLNAGEDKAVSTATELKTYLSIANSVLNVVADSVDLMIEEGASQEEIKHYLEVQTQQQFNHFDENFTGLYAYVNGEYMDGSGWVPPADYDPESRDWYKIAVDAGGELVIVSPYVDAQTGDVVISFVKLLSNSGTEGSYIKRNVAALDVIINHVQDVTDAVDISGKGYGMVITRDGMIVAHKEKSLIGKSIPEIFDQKIMNDINKTQSGTFTEYINGDDHTFFVSPVINQWYVVIVVDNKELYEDVRLQVTINIIISLIIFALITLIYYLGYKNEQLYGKKMEEFNANRQKQEYESRVLRLEKKAADEANKAKSSFLADMSHEIRTPINAILGMNEMILRESKDKGIMEYAKNVETSGKNLLALINGILDFSKIEEGKMEIVPVRYGMRSLISYLVNAVLTKANDKGLKFVLNIDETLPSELFGDDLRISQIIVNLLSNAVKYTHEGTVTLSMRVADISGEHVLLHVEVKDTGIGIRQEDMKKLFESFERLDVIINRSIEGTGLGMSIVTGLLKLMDSELKVESEYGKGSTFSFELWQRIENREAIGKYDLESTEAIKTDSYRELFHAPDARILIVDDTKTNLMVAKNFLKRTQIQIDTALSGQESIDLAGMIQYDVILMDQRMPGMNGTQAMEQIRALEFGLNRDTPVICLTADAIRGAKERYLAEGFNDYLTKPVEGKALEKMLLKFLPSDMVIRDFDEEETSAEVSSAEAPAAGKDDFMQRLEDAGIHATDALVFFNGDREFFKEILKAFINESDPRRDALLKGYADRDWDGYNITTHALKSTSKSFGADEISELAKTLEIASAEGDEALIDKEHQRLMSMYDDMVSCIKNALDMA